MAEPLTDFDRRLLDRLQHGVPLVESPWDVLARDLDTSPETLRARVGALRGGDEPVIREIAGIFEPASLGYQAALVACRVRPERLDQAGARVAEHPAVSHCYARRGTLNLWFTLSLAPDSRLGLAGTAERLKALSGADACHVLESLRRYKIGVHVGPAGQMASHGPTPFAPAPRPFSDAERAAIVALQRDLPDHAQPFAALAAEARLPADALLGIARALLDEGVLRRYGAVLHHRRAGVEANLLVAWRVGLAQADSAGRIAAEQPGVSHCFLRAPAEGWPYTLYTMIHGRSAQECALTADEIAAATGLHDRALLWTVREYKKARVRYFADGVQQWEASHAD